MEIPIFVLIFITPFLFLLIIYQLVVFSLHILTWVFTEFAEWGEDIRADNEARKKRPPSVSKIPLGKPSRRYKHGSKCINLIFFKYYYW